MIQYCSSDWLMSWHVYSIPLCQVKWHRHVHINVSSYEHVHIIRSYSVYCWIWLRKDVYGSLGRCRNLYEPKQYIYIYILNQVWTSSVHASMYTSMYVYPSSHLRREVGHVLLGHIKRIHSSLYPISRVPTWISFRKLAPVNRSERARSPPSPAAITTRASTVWERTSLTPSYITNISQPSFAFFPTVMLRIKLSLKPRSQTVMLPVFHGWETPVISETNKTCTLHKNERFILLNPQ